jgi:hypothetical protein
MYGPIRRRNKQRSKCNNETGITELRPEDIKVSLASKKGLEEEEEEKDQNASQESSVQFNQEDTQFDDEETSPSTSSEFSFTLADEDKIEKLEDIASKFGLKLLIEG